MHCENCRYSELAERQKKSRRMKHVNTFAIQVVLEVYRLPQIATQSASRCRMNLCFRAESFAPPLLGLACNQYRNSATRFKRGTGELCDQAGCVSSYACLGGFHVA